MITNENRCERPSPATLFRDLLTPPQFSKSRLPSTNCTVHFHTHTSFGWVGWGEGSPLWWRWGTPAWWVVGGIRRPVKCHNQTGWLGVTPHFQWLSQIVTSAYPALFKTKKHLSQRHSPAPRTHRARDTSLNWSVLSMTLAAVNQSLPIRIHHEWLSASAR